MKINKNSLCYWFPKIKDLDIPQPKTVIYKLPKQIYKRLWFEDFNAFKKINWIEVKKVVLLNQKMNWKGICGKSLSLTFVLMSLVDWILRRLCSENI